MKSTPQKKLNGLEKITEFLQLVFASGNIDGEKPLSCVLVAPVSSGKTTAIKQFSQKNPQIIVTTDSTTYGIIAKHGQKLKNSEISHIVMPDFLNSLARKKVSVDNLLMFINASSEDGIFPSMTFQLNINDYIAPFGWVLCLTTDGYAKKKSHLVGIGFESRFFIVYHKYSLEMINQIMNDIITESRFVIPQLKIKYAKKKKVIDGNIEIFTKLRTYSELLCNNGREEILRTQRKLQTLCKSSAYLRGSDKVEETDLNKIEALLSLLKQTK